MNAAVTVAIQERPTRAPVERLALLARPAVAAAALFWIATIVLTYPIALHITDALFQAPDELFQSWVIGWDAHALLTDPLHIYQANIYYPFPNSLTYSDAMLSGAVLVAPIFWITGNAVLAHNILMLGSMWLGGFGMYLLARHLTGSQLGGFLAGMIFGFCAIRESQLGHVQLLQIGWLPLALLYLQQSLVRARISDFVLFALFTIFQALASVYLAWMMAVVYFVFFVVEVARRRLSRHFRSMIGVASALLVACAAVVPVSLPYASTQALFDFRWPIDVIDGLSAVPSDYLSAAPLNVLYGPLLSQFTNASYPNEHHLFPGFVALALALVGFCKSTRSVEVLRYALLTVVGVVLSLGPSLAVGNQADSIGLPYLYLLQFVPGFSAMRVPARFDFVVMLGVAVLASFGVQWLQSRLTRRRWILIPLSILTVAELVPYSQQLLSVPTGVEVPAVYTWLRMQDPHAPIAEAPAVGELGFAAARYEYLSTYHWHRLLNGYSGLEPPAAGALWGDINTFPDPLAVEHLRAVGLQFLIVHMDELEPAAQQRFASADLTDLDVRVVATFGRDVVYGFDAPGDPAAMQAHTSLDLPTVVARGRPLTIPITLFDDTPRPLFLGAPERVQAEVVWNGAEKVRVPRFELPAFVEPGQQLPLLLTVALPEDVAAADSAQLRVDVTGSVQFDVRQTVRIADLPTSVQTAGLAAQLEDVQAPTVVAPGSPITIPLLARNSGQAVWLPDSPNDPGTEGAVGVGAKSWLSAEGKSAPAGGTATHVRWNVEPGQVVPLTVTSSAPMAPGHYRLVIDMLSEKVTWFGDLKGSSAVEVPIDVKP